MNDLYHLIRACVQTTELHESIAFIRLYIAPWIDIFVGQSYGGKTDLYFLVTEDDLMILLTRESEIEYEILHPFKEDPHEF